jgi:hypothetical protein
MSAASEAAGHASTANAPMTPNLVTKRIGTPPRFLSDAQTAAATDAVWPALSS